MENVFVFCGEHADLPVSRTAKAARLSLVAALSGGAAANRLSLSAKELELAEAHAALTAWDRDIEREAWGANYILADAVAMAAFASYRSTVLVMDDPFAGAAGWAQVLQVEPDVLRVRLQRSVMNAERVVAVGRAAERTVAPLSIRPVRYSSLPPMPLKASNAQTHVLMIVHTGYEELARGARHTLAAIHPETKFAIRDDRDAFERSWYAVIHIGPATSEEPGTRLQDAWAGGTPVLQLANPEDARFVRTEGTDQVLLVDPGRTGFLCPTIDALVTAFGDLMDDAVAARALARAAQRQVDAGRAWQSAAAEILQ